MNMNKTTFMAAYETICKLYGDMSDTAEASKVITEVTHRYLMMMAEFDNELAAAICKLIAEKRPPEDVGELYDMIDGEIAEVS